ncbi:hypothetical protein B0O99DRAFT_604475 [Bisporella sp. PMI_857]|nr:hypothetical protein B0O99DRAFT_604475 [Bisporella sp. PMI_857]
MLDNRITSVPRGPRHGSPSTRTGGTRGGGIRKRTSGPVKVDKDGDMVMGAEGVANVKSGKGDIGTAAPSRGRGNMRGRGGITRGSNLGTAKARQAILRGIGAQQANIVEPRLSTSGTSAKVDGLHMSKAASNPDGGVESLLAFLERKATGTGRTVKITKSHRKGTAVIVHASPEDITEILKLNNFTFAGSVLSIEAIESGLSSRGQDEKKAQSKETMELKGKWAAALSKRYDANHKLLNLSALGQDPDFGLEKLSAQSSTKIFPALMVVCDDQFTKAHEKRRAIISVSLANNSIDDVRNVNDLAVSFPHLQNLDLSNNNITSIKSLEGWRRKFRHLENLILTNNPIVTQEPNFGNEVLQWYPKLQMLNGVLVRTPEQVAALINAVNSPIPINTADFRDVGQVGENFIRQFVNLYDNDRAALLSNYYDNQSVFSLAINMSAPRDREHSSPIPPWAAYTKHSRNLSKITMPGPRMNRRYVGVQQIQSMWSDFPATRHPNLETQSDKYIIECRPQPGLPDPSGQSPRGVDGLLITIHGEFEEPAQSPAEIALRSFSRSFVLGPGAPGGIPIRVISDMMTLRAHSPLALPSYTNTQPQAKASQLIPNDLSPEQQFIAKQLMEKTGMTLEYTRMCLQETSWDLAQAYAAYEANKSKLPPNAFITGVPN